MTLRDRLEQNNYILDCPHCKKDVYKYIGRKPIPTQSVIHSVDFIPIFKKVKQPMPNQIMLCPFCRGILAPSGGGE